MKDFDDLPEMSPAARALLVETRSMDDPSGDDRDRVKRAMLGAIAGGGALAASTAVSSTAAAAGTGVAATVATAGGLALGIKIAAIVIVAGAVGGTALLVTQPEEPAPRPAIVRSREPAEVVQERVLEERTVERAPAEATLAPLVADEPEAVEAPAEPRTEEAAPPASRITRPLVRAPPVPDTAPLPSSLSAEVALLGRAHRAIAAHDGSTALGHLDELARRFPDGVMMEEREAARVFALCETGRRDEVRAAAQRFLRDHPTSPQRARVSGACP